MYLVLDNIRSSHNVGTLFRVCDALGAKDIKICLCGYTPGPKDKYGLELKKLTKVSLGAEKTVSFERFDSTQDCLKNLSSKGVDIYCLELTKNAKNYFEYSSFDWQNSALVLGNEVTGVDNVILDEYSNHIYIPMQGEKESLNVSVAASVVLFHLRNVGQ